METSFKFNGEPTVEALATGMATLGRYGDDHMVHASEGETFIPAEVFEANPDLRDRLFAQMRMMGEASPERFVVGNALNSINPITGQPEFFFKKIFKSVGKVFKKALPIIAPIVGNMIAPGIGGIVASALVTKLQGGSWGDALKSGAVSWATQGLTSGIGTAFSGEGFSGAGFMEGVGKGLTAPFGAASNIFSSGAANPLNQGIFGTAGVYGAKSAPARSMFDYLAPRYNPNAQFAADLPQNIAAQAGGYGLESSGMLPGSAPGSMVPVAAAQPSTPYLPPPRAQDAFFIEGGDGDFLMDVPGSDRAGISRLASLDDARPKVGAVPPRLKFEQTTAAKPRGLGALVASAEDPDLVMTDPRKAFGLSGGDAWYPDSGVGQYDILGPGPSPSMYSPPEIAPFGATDRANLVPPSPKDFATGTVVPLADGAYVVAETPLTTNRETGALSGGDKVFEKVKERGILDLGLTDAVQDTLEPLLGEKDAKLVAPYLKTAAVGAAVTAGAKLFEDNEVPDPVAQPREYEAYDEWRGLPDKNSPEAIELFREWNGPAHVTRSDYERLTGGPSDKPDWWFLPEAAHGGEVIGPGTGTSDSIPARLSDGEFVMTAEAVRNAGDGDRDLGAARMYDMMRRFEGGVG